MRKTALITGITGQDGSYLAEFLLEKGYDVHGIVRRASSFNTGRIEHILDKIQLHYGDMVDTSNLCSVLEKVQPDEIYNLAAQSHVKVSFEMPEYTGQCDALGTLRLLEALRTCRLDKRCRLYQASTSELYGKVQEIPQKETTPFYPRSPYACAKIYAYWATVNYREAYGMFCVNGILFNHESPRRGGTFVTKKVTAGVAQICAGLKEKISLGNLEAKRDWGHAYDYVRGMWMILQADEPDDFILATGKQYSVRHLVETAFGMAGRKIEWKGEGLNEQGIDTSTGKVVVVVDPAYYRPTEVETLLGDPTKAKEVIGWSTDICFEELIYDMMNHDMQLFGMTLPEVAMSFLPDGKLSYPDIQKYPDIEMQKKTSASHPEMVQGITSPTHGG